MALIELNRNPSRRELRLFAAVGFPAFFGLVGGLVLYFSGNLGISLAIWVSALLVSLIGLLRPPLMRIVYLGLLYVTFPIGWTISTLVVAGIYYLLLTPIGVLLRLVRRDALRLRRSRSAQSYWVELEMDDEIEHYLRQY